MFTRELKEVFRVKIYFGRCHNLRIMAFLGACVPLKLNAKFVDS